MVKLQNPFGGKMEETNNEEFINTLPEEIQEEAMEDLEHIEEENEKLIEDLIGENPSTISKVGRPKGIPATEAQKIAVGKAAKEYQQKLKDGLIEQPIWETHGAYSYMAGGRVPKKKRYLLEYVHNEREKWLSDLGGEENLNNIELSMLDEASRLLLFSTMVNDYLLSDKESEIIFKDGEGNLNMHTALSRHYLSFTKTYISILKELQKLTTAKPSKKNSGKKDSASLLQKLYKEN